MRIYTIVVSIVVHVVLVGVLIIVPLYAMDALPGVHRAVDFVQAKAAELPDVPPPPGSARKPSATETASPVAPTQAPERIEPELARVSVDPRVPVNDGPGGVPNGLGSGNLLLDVPTPPAPAPKELYRPGGNIRAPKKIKDVAPVYPPLAQAAQKEGLVILEAIIGEDGRVRDVRVLRSIPLLDQAAVDAVRQWRFTPTLLNGQPVPIVMTVSVDFRLQK